MIKFKYLPLLVFLLYPPCAYSQAEDMAPSVAPQNPPQAISNTGGMAPSLSPEQIPTADQGVLITQEGAQIISPPKEVELARIFYITAGLSEPAEFDKSATELKDFEIVTIHQNPKNPLHYELGVMAFALGDRTFTETAWKTKDGKEFKTKPFEVKINKTKTDIKTEGLVDIRRPYRPFNPWILLWVFLGIAAVYIIFRILSARDKNKKSLEASPYIKDNRPLYIIALEQIDNLLMEDFWSEGRYKFFYSRLIEIFRGYLTVRFSIDAFRYTSRDLLRKLKNMKEFKGSLKQVEELQRSSDFVKFARFEPTQIQRDNDIELLRNIIMDTRPEVEIAVTPTDSLGLKKVKGAEIVDIKASASKKVEAVVNEFEKKD